MRFDPFREIDRFFDDARGPQRARTIPMDAYRRGEEVVLHFDVPGVDPDNIDLSIEQDTLTVTADRRWEQEEDDELLANERPQGEFVRRVVLGRTLDTTKIAAKTENGVLTVRVPMATEAQRRRISIESTSE